LQGGWGDPSSLFYYSPTKPTFMDITDIIKESFEKWYNTTVSKDHPASFAINYSDQQTLTLKAYHRVCVEMVVIELVDGVSQMTPLFKIEENYNHGVMSEEEAKSNMMKKLLMEIYEHVKLL